MSSNRRRREPGPPTRNVGFTVPASKAEPSEVHEAFTSWGKSNKTRRLSDGEFNRQVKEEIGYLFDKSAYHARNAADALCDLWNLLF